MTITHSSTICRCCTPQSLPPSRLGRRGILGMAGAFLLGRAALAEDGTAYDSMVLTCIDPRFVTPVGTWMAGMGLQDKYSQFAIAGATVGVVAPSFAAWAPAFWENLGASIELHKITRVIAISHRDCGAAVIAYGADALAGRDKETALHRRVFNEFSAQVGQRQPKLKVAGGLMDLGGAVERFA